MAHRRGPDGVATGAGAGELHLREPHGVIQVAMGWEGLHLFQSYPADPAATARAPCPPEDCHDPTGFSAHRDGTTFWDELEDLASMTDSLRPLAMKAPMRAWTVRSNVSLSNLSIGTEARERCPEG